MYATRSDSVILFLDFIQITYPDKQSSCHINHVVYPDWLNKLSTYTGIVTLQGTMSPMTTFFLLLLFFRWFFVFILQMGTNDEFQGKL